MTDLLLNPPRDSKKINTIMAVCYALDIPLTRNDISSMFSLTEKEAKAVIESCKSRSVLKESIEGKYEFIAFDRVKHLDIELDTIAYAFYVVVKNKKITWSVLEMDLIIQRNMLSGNPNEAMVEITTQMAMYAKKERKYNIAIALYRVAAEFCVARHVDRNITVKAIVNLSGMEIIQGYVSPDVFQMQKAELARINMKTTSLSDVLLMFYYGLWCFHIGDPWEGYNYRKRAKDMLADFNTTGFEREIAIMDTLHYAYSGMVGNTVSSYESNMAVIDKDEDAPISGYYQITIMFAYIFLDEASKAQVSAETLLQRALEQNDKESAIIIQSTLGRAYLNNGILEKGKEALYKSYNDACNINHCWGQMYSLIGLLYYYKLIYDPHGCVDIFKQIMQTCEKYKLNFTQGSPFIIDVIKYIEDSGLSVEGYNYKDVVERHLKGPHMHVKGVAWRHKAQMLINQGAESKEIISAFKNSINILNMVGSYSELSKTQVAYAMYLLSIDNRDGAIVNARNARRIANLKGKQNFPVELTSLIGKDYEEEDDPMDLTPLKLELMQIVNKDIMISRLISSLERCLRAEKAAIILCKKGSSEVVFKDNSPYLKEGDDLYNEMMSRVAYCIDTDQIICISPKKKYISNDLSKTLFNPKLVIGIPLSIKKDVRLVIYLECFSRDNMLSAQEEQMLDTFRKDVSENVIAVICERSEDYVELADYNDAGSIDKQYYKSNDKVFNDIYSKIDKISATAVPVLITGETGVGKEVVAKEVFSKSEYQASFIKVNCGAIPENLIESELFGYEKGSFTGAGGRKIGYFEAAEGGTIFLDEIGELPLSAQVKLLRVLQEKEITRIGGTKTIPIDFRLIAATNKNLSDEVKNGTFREDLFYRLNIIQLEVPPLRQRKNDIIRMAKFYVNRFQSEVGKTNMYLSDDTLLWMVNYPWPGNIRELENTVHRAVLLSDGDEIRITKEEKKQSERIHVETLEEVEREHIIKVLNICDGRISGPNGAAELLGMKRTTLQARMEKLGIKKN